MPSDAPAGLPTEGTWQRLHPLTMLFAIGARLYGLRGLAVPGVVALAVSRHRDPTGGWFGFDGWLLVPVGVLLLLFELVQYFTLAYRFDPHEIVIKRGLFWKRERHIPYARVQNIELVQNAAHRLAGVAVARLDTGTGAGAEGELSVLSLDAIAALREAVRVGRHGEATSLPGPETHAPGVLIALTPRELLLHGLLTASGWVVIAAAAGALWQLDLDGWDIAERYLPSTEGVWGELRQATPILVLEIALLVALAVLVFRVLSAVWSAIKHFEFSLTARGDELFQSYGLLTRVGRTIPRARIQKLTVSEEPLMRLFGRATLTIDTAASVSEQQQQHQADGGSHVLVPIVPASRIAALVRDVHPAGAAAPPDLDAVQWQGVDPRAFRRLVRVRLVIAAVIGAASYGAAHRWAVVIGLVAAAALAAQAWVAARFTAFAWSGDTLCFRSGTATRHVTLVRTGRAQVVTLECSPFDRRWGMAGVRVDTAGAARGGHAVHIRWLPADVAVALYTRLRHAAAP